MSTEEFIELYKGCYNPFLQYVKSIIYNSEEAEDINANVFFRLYKIHETIRPETAIGYIKKIMNNACVDYMRKVKFRREWHKKQKQYSDEILMPIEKNNLIVHVNKLPPEQRYLVTMRYLMGYEPEELAKMQNKSRSTVRNQLCAGLKSLRKQLHEA